VSAARPAACGEPPVVNVVHKLGTLTIRVVARLFSFEGGRRQTQTELGIQELWYERRSCG
jgi:cell division GTPase FtsZ